MELPHTGLLLTPEVEMRARMWCVVVSVVAAVGVQAGREEAPERKRPLRLKAARPAEGAPRMVALRPAEKARMARSLGLTVPEGGITSSLVLSPRDGYRGQSGYLKFILGMVDYNQNLHLIRNDEIAQIEMRFRLANPSQEVLMIVTARIQGKGKLDMWDRGPYEMGADANSLQFSGNGTFEHLAVVLDCGTPGWYEVRMDPSFASNQGSFDFRQVELSIL